MEKQVKKLESFAPEDGHIESVLVGERELDALTTKLAANKASRVLVAFEESVQYYKNPGKVEVVGMPIREEFTTITQQDAKKELGLEGKTVVVSAFGSLGAKVMNETMADMMPLEQADGFPFHHIHATGKFGKEWMPQRVKDNGVDWENCEAIDIREYIYNMPTVMAAADVIISRAGASSCNEIAASGTPCILIPSPNVTDDHQTKNALALVDKDAALYVKDTDATTALVALALTTIKDEDKLAQLRTNILTLAFHFFVLSVNDLKSFLKNISLARLEAISRFFARSEFRLAKADEMFLTRSASCSLLSSIDELSFSKMYSNDIINISFLSD